MGLFVRRMMLGALGLAVTLLIAPTDGQARPRKTDDNKAAPSAGATARDKAPASPAKTKRRTATEAKRKDAAGATARERGKAHAAGKSTRSTAAKPKLKGDTAPANDVKPPVTRQAAPPSARADANANQPGKRDHKSIDAGRAEAAQKKMRRAPKGARKE